MDKLDVPQDDSQTYGGHSKVLYAKNKAGDYETVCSTGWESEEYVTMMAVDELNDLARQAKERVLNDETSPLEYHMYANRLDLISLSQATGYFKWRIKRHLRPGVFTKLSHKQLVRYAHVMGISVDDLKRKPQPNQP